MADNFLVIIETCRKATSFAAIMVQPLLDPVPLIFDRIGGEREGWKMGVSRHLRAAAFIASATISEYASAQTAADPKVQLTGDDRKALAQEVADAVKKAQEDKATQKFGGIEFGIGLSFTIDTGDRGRVKDASVINDIVRVNDDDNGRARIMLESHYFFTPKLKFLGVENDSPSKGDQQKKQIGIGPFIALQAGKDEIIEAIGAGFMVGFRRSASSTESFNIGVGLIVDPNTRVLGDGLEAGKPLPAGETMIRYKDTMQMGVLILTSFSF